MQITDVLSAADENATIGVITKENSKL